MGDIPTIDDQHSIINVWDTKNVLHSFNVTDLKDMTVFQFQQFLWSQPDFLGKTDMICHEFECSKDKLEIKPLELKKKLLSLKKKWGTNKTDNYHRIIIMGPNEHYEPEGFVLQKKKQNRLSFKRVKSDKRGSEKRSSDKRKSERRPKESSLDTIPETSSIPQPISSNAPLGIAPPPPPPPGLGTPSLSGPNNVLPPPPGSGSVPPPPKTTLPLSNNSTTSNTPNGDVEKKQSWWNRRKSKKIEKNDLLDTLSTDQMINELLQNAPPGESRISADELKTGYLNLNTSKMNQLAKNERFQTILISWVNTKLEKRKLRIGNLNSDLRNGVILINLLEVLSNQEMKKYHKDPKHIPHELENLERVLKFLKAVGIQTQAEPQDIYHGRVGIIAGILYTLLSKDKEGNLLLKKKKKLDIKVEKLDKLKAEQILSKVQMEEQQTDTEPFTSNYSTSPPNYSTSPPNFSTSPPNYSTSPPNFSTSPPNYSTSPPSDPPKMPPSTPPKLPPSIPPKVPPKMPPTLVGKRPPEPVQNTNITLPFPKKMPPPVPSSQVDNTSFSDLPPPPPPLEDDYEVDTIPSPPEDNLDDITLDDLDTNLLDDIIDLDNLDIDMTFDIEDEFNGLEDVQNFLDNMVLDGIQMDNIQLSFEDRFV